MLRGCAAGTWPLSMTIASVDALKLCRHSPTVYFTPKTSYPYDSKTFNPCSLRANFPNCAASSGCWLERNVASTIFACRLRKDRQIDRLKPLGLFHRRIPNDSRVGSFKNTALATSVTVA